MSISRWQVAGLAAVATIAAAALPAAQATGPGASRLETQNYVRFYAASDPSSFYACLRNDGTPCDDVVLAPGTNWTVNYLSSSAAGFGVLRGDASVFLTGDGLLDAFPSFVSVGGRSGFRDTLTVTGEAGAGTMVMVFQVTGTSGATPGGSGRPQFQWVPVVNGAPNFGASRNFVVSAGTAVVSFPFVFDTPTSFAVYFYALAQIFNWVPGASAFADYDSTAILVQIGITNSAGQTVENFQIQSASGTAYEADGVVRAVMIDVKPGDGTATINTRSNGVTMVAVLSAVDFDAVATVDQATLTFGRTGLEQSVEACTEADVNGDGLRDLACRCRTDLLGLVPGSTLARLQGFTLAGIPIAGADTVRVIW